MVLAEELEEAKARAEKAEAERDRLREYNAILVSGEVLRKIEVENDCLCAALREVGEWCHRDRGIVETLSWQKGYREAQADLLELLELRHAGILSCHSISPATLEEG
jgi:hypothetical protein